MPAASIDSRFDLEPATVGPFTMLRDLCIAAMLFVIIPTVAVGSAAAGPQSLWFATVTVAVLTLALGIAAARALFTRWPVMLGAWAVWALAISMLMSLAINAPVDRTGVFLTSAAFVAAAFASSIAAIDHSRFIRFVAGPLLAAATVQSIIMAAQVITKEPLVIRWLHPGLVLEVSDGILRARGTMNHVFEPALMAIVALGCMAAIAPLAGTRPWWLIATAVTAGAVTLSYSRAALIATLLIIGALVMAHRRGTGGARNLAAAIAVGLVVAGALVAPGWSTKAAHSASTDLDEMSLGRVTLIQHSLKVIRDHPLTGVGTGKYERVLEEEYLVAERPYLPHVFALAYAVELGVPLAVAITALIVLLGIGAIRAGPAVAATYVGMIPWLLLDKLYYDRIGGILMFSAWIGIVTYALRRHDTATARSSSPTAASP